MIETEVIQHQPEIAAVGFEIDVEHVAEHRMLPAAASTPMFVSILRSLSFGTPRCRASLTIRRLMAGAPKSPSPGINPSIESAPNEMLVPGTRSAVSISPANPRIRRSRTSRSIGMSCFLHSADPRVMPACHAVAFCLPRRLIACSNVAGVENPCAGWLFPRFLCGYRNQGADEAYSLPRSQSAASVGSTDQWLVAAVAPSAVPPRKKPLGGRVRTLSLQSPL